MNEREREKFVEKSMHYGLNPDFYGQGCLSETGELYILTGFYGNSCELESMIGTKIMFPFSETVEMIVRELDAEVSEIPQKLLLLGMDQDVKAARRAEEDIKKQAERAKVNALNALEIASWDFENVLESMGIPAKQDRLGCMLNGELYEFVSYDQESNMPFILENLDKDMWDTGRFHHASFSELKKGAKEYAKSQSGEYAAYMLQVVQSMTEPEEKEEDGYGFGFGFGFGLEQFFA